MSDGHAGIPDPRRPTRRRRLTLHPSCWPIWRRWAGLVALSVLLMGLGQLAHLSAALLIGAMLAAIVFAALDASVEVPRPLFQAGQAIIGCVIARSMSASILHQMAERWPLFLATFASVLVTAIAIGIVLTRFRVLPGTTALWGSFPGAATAMTLMSQDYGADMRLVAFMQYLRAALTALVATGVARVFAGHVPTAGAPTSWAAPIAVGPFAATIAVATLAAIAGRRLKVPAGALIGPMVVASLLQALGVIKIELPTPLLALAYTVVGWGIGLRFSREVIEEAADRFWSVLAAIVTLIGACGLLAVALVYLAGYDPMTAYLAMSPGGVDSVAIIATSSGKVDVQFVMALQMIRFFFVLVAGPPLAKLIARCLHTPETRN